MTLRKRNLVLALLLAVVATAAGAQNKTLTERPISDIPPLVKRALVIGIGNYKHATRLAPYTQNDARAFAAFLHANWNFSTDSITLMTDEPGTTDALAPTYLNVMRETDNLVASLNPRSVVVVYFSGHGKQQDGHDWIVPLDGFPNNVANSCIDYTDLVTRINERLPGRALFVVDACRSLDGAKPAESSGFGSSSIPTIPQIAQLYSCQPRELSQLVIIGDFKQKQSVFTHFLLKGLSGAQDAQDHGLVTFDSLSVFVRNRVSQYVQSKFKQSQNPFGKASPGKMVIAKASTPAVDPNKGKTSGGSINDSPAMKAVLVLNSDPPGAHIFIDDEDTGKTTPNTFTFTPDDATRDLKVRLELDDYQPRPLDVRLVRGAQTGAHQTIKLVRNPQGPARTRINPKDGAEMAFIPGGTFRNGDSDQSNNPVHSVTLSGYFIYKKDVTVAQFRKFTEDTAHNGGYTYDWKKYEPSWGWIDNHPMVNVSWNDARAYCKWAGVRLLTEAEWEHAARGPQNFKFPWGDTFDSSKLQCSKAQSADAGSTSPVGTFPANGFGLFDMVGNVWQWCQDTYHAEFWKSGASHGNDPVQLINGPSRVYRGGSWFSCMDDDFRTSYRGWDLPDIRPSVLGFRCASGQ